MSDPVLNPKPSSLDETRFIEVYGGIYEDTPWIAETVWPQTRDGTLDTADTLATALRAVVDAASDLRKIDLLCAHPELAGRAAQSGTLTASSQVEQTGAGLDSCSAEELEEFAQLNKAYKEKFGFPFIIAVAGRTRFEILDIFRTRLDSDTQTEFETALEQVHRIARLRLSAMTGD